MGTDRFWVKEVEHEIADSGDLVTIWLDGGSLNRYRDYALDRALFQGRLHFMDVYRKPSFELDDGLKKLFPG